MQELHMHVILRHMRDTYPGSSEGLLRVNFLNVDYMYDFFLEFTAQRALRDILINVCPRDIKMSLLAHWECLSSTMVHVIRLIASRLGSPI